MNDITLELSRLRVLRGVDFVRQLKKVVHFGIFKPVANDKDIFAAAGNHRDDFPLLLETARKAVVHGNKVYILPNPKGIRSADFIFENKGVFKMYDLKTITGQSSVGNRLIESIEQTNRVLINIRSTYNVRLLAVQIKDYFNANPNALEVLIYKGKKTISVSRRFVENPLYMILFRQKYKQ